MARLTLGELLRRELIVDKTVAIKENTTACTDNDMEQDILETRLSDMLVRGTDKPSSVVNGEWLWFYKRSYSGSSLIPFVPHFFSRRSESDGDEHKSKSVGEQTTFNNDISKHFSKPSNIATESVHSDVRRIREPVIRNVFSRFRRKRSVTKKKLERVSHEGSHFLDLVVFTTMILIISFYLVQTIVIGFPDSGIISAEGYQALEIEQRP